MGFVKSSSFAQHEYVCDSYCRNILQKQLGKKFPEDMYLKTDKIRKYKRKIRVRGLEGSAKGKTNTVKSSSFQIVWGSLGIGQTAMDFNLESSGNTYDMKNTSSDISYMFGNKLTLTLGLGSPTSGEGTINTSGNVYSSDNVSGLSTFGTLGIGIGPLEFLAGIREDQITYINLTDSNLNTTLGSDFKIKGRQFLIGIGVSW